MGLLTRQVIRFPSYLIWRRRTDVQRQGAIMEHVVLLSNFLVVLTFPKAIFASTVYFICWNAAPQADPVESPVRSKWVEQPRRPVKVTRFPVESPVRSKRVEQPRRAVKGISDSFFENHQTGLPVWLMHHGLIQHVHITCLTLAAWPISLQPKGTIIWFDLVFRTPICLLFFLARKRFYKGKKWKQKVAQCNRRVKPPFPL